MQHCVKPCQAGQKARWLGRDLGRGGIGYWAYLLQALLQAWDVEPGRVPVPALY